MNVYGKKGGGGANAGVPAIELTDGWLLSMVRVLTVRVEELELRLRDERGDHAFRDYEEAVARKIGHDGEAENVIGLRGRRKP